MFQSIACQLFVGLETVLRWKWDSKITIIKLMINLMMLIRTFNVGLLKQLTSGRIARAREGEKRAVC